MPKNAQNKKVYDNYLMCLSDGTPMAYIDEKKANWYLTRNLAIKGDDNKILLKFEPNGIGNYHSGEYWQTPLQNKCVVCGSKKQLNKHHCVPLLYRKLFSDKYKNRFSFDVLSTCVNCHCIYEKEADKLKIRLKNIIAKSVVEEYEILTAEQGLTLNGLKARIYKKAWALLNYRKQIPKVVRREMMREILFLFNKNRLNSDFLRQRIEKWPPNSSVIDAECKQATAEYIVDNVDLDKFIIMWRKHFVRTMKPKHLPTGWGIDKPTERLL